MVGWFLVAPALLPVPDTTRHKAHRQECLCYKYKALQKVVHRESNG